MILLFGFYLILSFQASAQTVEEAQIPTKPSIPSFSPRRETPTPPPCERFVRHNGEDRPLDSYVQKDGKGLQNLLSDTPDALAELESYVRNRKNLRINAYLGTASLLAIASGVLISHPPFDPVSGAPNAGGYLMLGGLALAVHSFIYGMSVNRANELHLQKAVDHYNRAHPQNNLQLLFQTQLAFEFL